MNIHRYTKCAHQGSYSPLFLLLVLIFGVGSLFFDCDDGNPVTPQNYTITASAGSNGTISPSGAVSVAVGEDKTFTITPNSGYEVEDVKVDGASKGAVTTYTFTDVTADHSIGATFKSALTVEVVTTLSGSYTDAAKQYRLDGKITVNSAVTMGKNTKFEINDTVSVKESGNLTIEEGVALTFGSKGAIVVGENSTGVLAINGKTANRVVLSSKNSGEKWDGIYLGSGAAGSVIKGVDVQNAETGIRVVNAVVNITDSRITRCSSTGVIYEDSARPGNLDGSGFANNVIMDCDTFGMIVNSGAVGYLSTNDSILDTIEIVRGRMIDISQTWRPQPKPYVVSVTVTVRNNATLTIQAGTKLHYNFNAGLDVGDASPAVLQVEGTRDAPVVMRARVTSDGWTAQGNSLDVGAIIIYPEATGSNLRFLHLDGASQNGIWIRDAIVNITDCRVTNCLGTGIYYRDLARPEHSDGSGFRNNVIMGCGKDNEDPYVTNAGLAVNPNALGYMSVNDSIMDTIYIIQGTQVVQPLGNQTWLKQPMPFVVVVKPILIDSGSITLAAGTTFLFNNANGNTGIQVGSIGPGSLKIAGTREMPVIMQPHITESPWFSEGTNGGLVFDQFAKPDTVDHLRLSGSARNGIHINKSQMTIKNLDLDSCANAGIRVESGDTPPNASLTLEDADISDCEYGITLVNSSVLDTARVSFSNVTENVYQEP